MEPISTPAGLTQNQARRKVSILITSRNRIEVLTICLESVLKQSYEPVEVLVLDDNSSRYRLDELISSKFNDLRLRCFHTDVSLGVAGGRNFLMQRAEGDIFCIIDDDAYFDDNHCVARMVAALQTHSEVGILAFKVIDHQAGQTALLVPFSQRWCKKQPDLVGAPRLVSYYLGTCHAIRRSVIEQCGSYQDDLVYGEEELDLSYRIIEANFRVMYLPAVVVHHHPQPSVVNHKAYRQPELYYHVRNRFFLSYKYLPWFYIPVYLAIWLSRYGLQAIKSRSLKEFLNGIAAGLIMLKGLKRTPLKPESIKYLKANYGRLWY